MSDVPACFVGAWRRVSIALGDGAPQEPADVVWLQARRGFADVRIPRRAGIEPVAFAGITTWDSPALTWHHHLDLAPGPAAADVGAVEWRDGDLVERGVLVVDGEPTTYEEVWRREPRPVAPVVVLSHNGADGRCGGMLVRVGDDAIVVAGTDRGIAARWDRREGARWWTVGSVGPASLLPAILDVLGERVATGWRVLEPED